jgi:hypothetical protein
MAYIKRMPTGDVGGTFGDAGFIGGGDTPTTAGDSQGWYNIQDFLGANKGDTTGQRIAGSALDKEIEAGKSNLQNQISNLSPLQTAQTGDLNALLEADDYSQIGNIYNQQYQSPSAPEFNPITSSSVEALQPNQFNTITDFIGGVQKNNSTYTPGMQKMDELLMRGDTDFAQNFAQQAKDKYASEINNPYQEAVANREKAQQGAKQNIESARQDWQSQVADWTGQAGRDIESTLTRQRSDYDRGKLLYQENTPISPFVDEATRARQFNTILSAAPYESVLGVAPTRETAVSELGQTRGNFADDYNALQSLIGENPNYISASSNPYNYIIKNSDALAELQAGQNISSRILDILMDKGYFQDGKWTF